VGAYGIMLYHYFVGRSHPYNWFHASLPAVIVLTTLAGAGLRTLEGRRSAGTLARRLLALVPFAVLAAVLGLLAAAPSVRAYPGVLSGRWSTPGVLWDIPGAGFRTPPATEVVRERVRAVVTHIRNTVPPAEPVAILSEHDGLLHVLADRRPFSRFVPLYAVVVVDGQVEEALAALDAPGLRHVYLERILGPSVWSHDLPPILFDRVARDFEPVGRVATFEVWRRRERPSP
jgi:hypothetical protein